MNINDDIYDESKILQDVCGVQIYRHCGFLVFCKEEIIIYLLNLGIFLYS